MWQGVDGLNLGERRGTYPVAGVGGGLAQLARRALAAVFVVMVVTLIVKQPPAAFTKGVIAGAVLLGPMGLTLAWRRVTARLGISRCYLCTGGVVVTNLFGRVRDSVTWSDVTELSGFTNQSLFLSFHRFELARRGSARPLAFLALGMNPELVKALQHQAARNGVR